MSRIRKVLLALLLLLAAPIAVVMLRPELVLNTLTRSTLAGLGYEITQLDVRHLGISSAAIQQLTLVGAGQSVELERIHAQYSFSQLLAGSVQSVSVGAIALHMQSSSTPASETTVTLAALLDSFDALAINELVLPNIALVDAEQGYRIGLGIQSPPLRIAGEAQLEAIPDTRFEFDVNRTAAKDLSIESRAFRKGELIGESDLLLHALESSIDVSASSSIFFEPLQAWLAQWLPASAAISNDSLSLQSRFEVHNLFGDASISQLGLLLDSPGSTVEISQLSELGSSSFRLQLPLRIEGSIPSSSGELQLTFSEIAGTANWSLEGASAAGEHAFEDTQLSCTAFNDCALQSQWRSSLASWQYGGYLGENSSVTAALRLNYSNEEIRLAADTATLRIPSLIGPPDSLVSTLTTDIQLDTLEFRAGDLISGGFNFTSDGFRLVNTIAELGNPAFSGKLQLEEDVLTGIAEIDLDQKLRLGIGLQHFFHRDTGDVVLQLGAIEFTETTPLSALINPQQLNADVIAGRIEGLANISWSKQLDGSWRFGGPIALKVDQLSGYYEDYLFVDLRTDLFAEATTPLGIQVTNPASASLRRIDIGLPLEQLSWQYRFDTLSREVEITDFDTELLGGKLSIAAARYNPRRDRQQVDVVLADLRVDSLVSLVDYPGLRADGLISGYLPFIIEGETISIERGLVGALKPGGSIRYTPENAVPSDNQSIKLVNDALSNYQYQTMNTEVSYSEDGELLLDVQLRGSNPDMNNGQAINLNVNITDNIPSLLKSLQASRVITEELERLVERE